MSWGSNPFSFYFLEDFAKKKKKVLASLVAQGQRIHLPTREMQETQDTPWFGKIPWSRKCKPTPGFFLGKSNGQRNMASCSSWDCKESDMTEQLNAYTQVRFLYPLGFFQDFFLSVFFFSLSIICLFAHFGSICPTWWSLSFLDLRFGVFI